jgi:hypothetical protein
MQLQSAFASREGRFDVGSANMQPDGDHVRVELLASSKVGVGFSISLEREIAAGTVVKWLAYEVKVSWPSSACR